MSLNNQIIVITGAGRGIGRALAVEFAKAGAKLSICSRNASEIQETAKECKGEVLARVCDIADAKAVNAWIQETVKKFGRIDVLINNAGIAGPRVSIAEYPDQDWSEVVRVNMDGLFFVTKSVLNQAMLKANSGVIVNLSSGVGRKGKANWGAYAVSKFGYEGFTQVLASELKEKGIKVFSLNPQQTRTKMRAGAYPQEDPATLKPPEALAGSVAYLIEKAGIEESGEAFDYAEGGVKKYKP